ncbi:DUF5689 domain-containing protein [Pedobacter jejuensis]|uniref:DUF5689 domain-containing protein n=1 Tax=Pedobacter jejuensis TaxID=1268550 RepID=A0A3N0BTT5_9SPHI|nr:DUF5689 domain-containing protein [Pedobacter jejuensis]RNL52438.1 hypothetical protein D7004_12840 [Pedobacter jejuensis]
MKKIFIYTSALILFCSIWLGCKRESDYVKVSVSPYISNFDLRKLFKNADLSLNTENLGGADFIKGVVISNYTGSNTPAGLLVIQNSRIAGSGIDSLRGIAINIGSEASKYIPGDSVHVKISGSTLTRISGILQITGVSPTNIEKKATGRNIITRAVNTASLTSRPQFYESTLITISKGNVDPVPATGEKVVGNKTINDGFGSAVVHTEASAVFANQDLTQFADFTGIVFTTATGPQVWPRTFDDIFPLAVIKPSALVITGYLTDPTGADNNYEYIQFKATRDINFATTPYSIVTCNNAGILAAPATGWALGGVRTYKINITSGTVRKGQFCYVGGNKNIWGAGTTDISSAVWLSSTQYSNVNSVDFGTATSNLLANSGNVAGIAVFEGIRVDGNSIPLDVIMYGGNGAVYSAGPPEAGYRITNTDKYSTIQNRKTVAFYGAGTNTSKFAFPTNAGNFTHLGGVYDAKTGLWSTGRAAQFITLTTTSPLSVIETPAGFTTIVN